MAKIHSETMKTTKLVYSHLIKKDINISGICPLYKIFIYQEIN